MTIPDRPDESEVPQSVHGNYPAPMMTRRTFALWMFSLAFGVVLMCVMLWSVAHG